MTEDYQGPLCPHDPPCANRGICFGRKTLAPCGHKACGPRDSWTGCTKEEQ